MDTFNAQRTARIEYESRIRSIPPVREDVMWERGEQRKSPHSPIGLLRTALLAIFNMIFRSYWLQ